MTIWEAIILGLVQGITEFLPVSSSGHLVLVQGFLGVESDSVTFEVIVHFGTLLSVIIYFWKKLWRMLLSILPPFREEYAPERKMIFYLFLASIPAAIVGFSPLKDVFEGYYERPALVGIFLIFTGVILFMPRLIAAKRQTAVLKEVGPLEAIAMGLGQALAILPGVSRSGSSIVGGLLAGVKPSAAAEFSFLMAIPAIIAATVMEIPKMGNMTSPELVNSALALIVAFASGLFAIYSVLSAIRKGRFESFGIYCLLMGVFAYLWFR